MNFFLGTRPQRTIAVSPGTRVAATHAAAHPRKLAGLDLTIPMATAGLVFLAAAVVLPRVLTTLATDAAFLAALRTASL